MKQQLEIEKSQFERQDNIYRILFKNEPHRLDYSLYPDAQRDDIDLVIKNRSGRPLKVSEKYRPVDYDDILFEVWSVYSTKRGWSLESKADIMTYWTPIRLVIVDMKKVVETFENNRVSDQISFIEGNKEIHGILLNGKTYYPLVIRADNKGYSTLSIALNFQTLEKLHIKFSVIPLG